MKLDEQVFNGTKQPGKSIFVIKPGNQWLVDASCKPQPESLYMNLWFEGEVCILFGDTGIGKSIKAVQIGNSIAAKRKVIYFDFELSDKQFEARYSNNFFNHYNFPDNFFRAEINSDEADYAGAGFHSVTEYINASIETAIQETGAKILIIDNITYLRHETEKAKDALPLMKDLKALKNKYDLSILVLAHTPKRNLAQPLSRNDLQGSKMLINFCDSAFALGESAKDKSLRYLKQIKARNSEIVYDTDNVALFEIAKPENFLMFTPVHGVHTTCEHEHLKHYSREDKEEIKARVIELNNKGYTQRRISDETGIGLGTVNKYISVHKCS
jgi:KaiC/GvpD/RAD55 family RecA-like ATPase